jgi:hypothetical protein
MNIALALEYIPRRMKELGHGSDYYLRFKHLIISNEEALEIDAYNQLYILIEESYSVTIESDFGYYDLNQKYLNEQSYEHQGKIVIKNINQDDKVIDIGKGEGTDTGKGLTAVKFIQVIPKHKTKNDHANTI